MTLSTLLVVVPALLPVSFGAVTEPFSNPEIIRPLQQKLVDQVRNTASHTIAAFRDTEARELRTLCSEWLDAWARLEGFESSSRIPGIVDAPDATILTDLLFDTPSFETAAD